MTMNRIADDRRAGRPARGFFPAEMIARAGGSLLLGLLLAAATGCEKQAKPANPSVGLVTQGGNAESASTYADANLADLTRELRRWIVKTKQRPASFEDFAAKAQIQVPPPPAGKKYVITQEMRVALADR
jgi:hypothetical protein